MSEALKNRVVIVLAILSVIFFFGTLSSCNNAMRQTAERNKEKAARITLEEKTSKYVQEKSALEEKAKAKENELQELKTTLEAVKKDLVQGQLVSQSLKEELQKVTKSKEALEEELRQALVNVKKLK